jgi:hypothetical protein
VGSLIYLGNGHCTMLNFVGYVQFSERLTMQSGKAFTITRLLIASFLEMIYIYSCAVYAK